MPFVVALTGGIGSGKTLVSDAFAKLGATIVDTDRIAHQLTESGGDALQAIVEAFGRRMLRDDGSLDRKRMRALVFANPEARQRLENILHPLIRAKVQREIETSRGPYVILVVPLLVETGAYRDSIARVLVVDCDEHLQVERVISRSGLAPEQVQAIMRAQAPRRERLAHADDVISNENAPEAILPQVARLHELYLRLAGTRA
jgi:dephospho-CoA kinase